MMIIPRGLKRSLRLGAASAVVLAGVATPATAVDFEYSGYARAHFSMNLSSNTSLKNGFGDSNQGGRYEMSMARFSGKIESSWDFGAFQIGSVFRVVEEHETSYEKGLENSTILGPIVAKNHDLTVAGNPLAILGLPPGTTGVDLFPVFTAGATGVTAGICQPGASAAPFLPGQTYCNTAPFTGLNSSDFGAGANGTFLSDYDENRFHDMMRELYVTFDVGKRTHFKLGKQQVVWGETDFFRAMDIIHGYDLTWRSFLETENEELRKPLILANVEIDVPELGGTLQLIYRPGWDEGADVGTTAPLGGSRWAPQPWTGNNVPASIIGPRNFHHSAGDEDDANYGFRWSGVYNQIGYSLAYWKGLDNDGLVVRNPILGGSTNFGKWEQNSSAVAGFVPGSSQNLTNLISPEIETFGASLNAYTETLDMVLRAELAFTPDKPYNTGTATNVDLLAFGLGCADGVAGTCGAALGGLPAALTVLRNDPQNLAATAYNPLTSVDAGIVLSVPGLGKVVEKDTLRIMLGFDKNLNLMNLLGTQRPSFWTVQLFDTWITNFDKDDDIVDLFGFGSAKREHSTILTNAITLNYAYDTINPGLAVGVDLGNFDMFLIPSVDFVFGDHWRVRLEADIFLPRHSKTKNLGFVENDTRLLGTLDDNDQLVARITYQF
ncbi:MAG: hypothetical protein P1U54_00685 [Immundisolibacteraceae bacterium]|nr:hypothetical protein [Immundisolibacteraceae bacterium]